MSGLKQEISNQFNYVKSTDWWIWAMEEIEQRKQNAIRDLLQAKDMESVFYLQGRVHALNKIINIISAPDADEQED